MARNQRRLKLHLSAKSTSTLLALRLERRTKFESVCDLGDGLTYRVHLGKTLSRRDSPIGPGAEVSHFLVSPHDTVIRDALVDGEHQLDGKLRQVFAEVKAASRLQQGQGRAGNNALGVDWMALGQRAEISAT